MKINTQTNFIKNIFGLNTFELAAILSIDRSKVYGCLEATSYVKLRKDDQERLSIIYTICDIWRKKNIGRLGNYLYRIVDNEHPSLFFLLTRENIDKQLVQKMLDKISFSVEKDKLREKRHDDTLKKYGFREMTSEEIRERLDDISTSAG